MTVPELAHRPYFSLPLERLRPWNYYRLTSGTRLL